MVSRELWSLLILWSMFTLLLIATYWNAMGTATLATLYSATSGPRAGEQLEGGPQKTQPADEEASFLSVSDAFVNQFLDDIKDPMEQLSEQHLSGNAQHQPNSSKSDKVLLMRKWKIHLSPISQKLKQRQKEREETFRSVCSANSTFPGKNRKFDDIPDKELEHFIMDDRHKIIYCFVPKVACTNWKRIMAVLSERRVGGVVYHDPLNIPHDAIHEENLQLTFDKFKKRYGSSSRQMMKIKLQKYTKFLFVRDPFVKLISAFRNKFEERNDVFYKLYARDMLKKYGKCPKPPASFTESLASGIRPKSSHFIQYLLDPETEKRGPYDPHWRQVYRMCHPCQINYDFVGKLETLDEDAEHLLRILRVDNVVNFPVSGRKQTTISWEQDSEYFASIPYEWRRQLNKLYQADFRLFGYDKPEELMNE
ncbi:carbohydrate sulfotransferase 12-like [Engraulis encrasicolus]|uniref:carbohydrate sulfotransferase 12-like n=1 Tax=Engraulis encrasicolus TaxID=184585 RepID=UPI002FD24188